MSDTPDIPTDTSELTAIPGTRRRWRGGLIGLGLLATLGLGGYALAMGGPGGLPGGWHGPWDPARRLEYMQAFSKRALDGVGATADQENRIHDIIANAYAAVNKDRPSPEAMRKRLTELLKAPTVDRNAVEAARAEMVAGLDARSKIVAGAVADVAGQLSADQRGRLADRLAAIAERRHGFGGWDRPWGAGGAGEGRPGEGRPSDNGSRPSGAPDARPSAD